MYKIIVSKGNFSSPEYAAFAENEINWQDKNAVGADACVQCYAAVDVQKNLWLKKKLKAEIIATEEFDFSKSYDDTVLVLLGFDTVQYAAEKMGFDVPQLASLSEEGYQIRGFNCQNMTVISICGRTCVGTLYGAYTYLERHGIRFISPGDDGTYYHSDYDKSNEKIFDIVENPSFKTRGAYSEYVMDKSYDFILWVSHNKLNYANLYKVEHPQILKKLGIGIAGGGHGIHYQYMEMNQEYPYKHPLFEGPGKKEDPYPISSLYQGDVNGDGILTYGEAHPEWYAEIEGKRRLSRNYELQKVGYYTGDYICTSNEYGVTEFVKLLVDALAEGEWKYLDYVDFWALDNGKWCDCEKCRKEKTLSYRQLMLAYKLDKAIKKATEEGRINRTIKIIVPAYHETLPAPDMDLPEDFDYNTIFVVYFVIERCYQHNINDPCCRETNKLLIDRLLPWVEGHYKGELMIGEYYNVGKFAALPFILTEKILNDIPYYYKVGARHFHYMHITARRWGMSAIHNFLYSKLLWNVQLNGEELKQEYYLMRYCEHAGDMRRLYERLEATTANCKYLKHYQYIDSGNRSGIESLWQYLYQDRREFMNTLHMRFDTRAEDVHAGPSLQETVVEFRKCYETYMAMPEKSEEDEEQMYYGLCMLEFLYQVTACKRLNNEGEKPSEELLLAMQQSAERLREITRPLSGYDKKWAFSNGLEASFLKDVYEKLLINE